jgi:hypothetical protein
MQTAKSFKTLTPVYHPTISHITEHGELKTRQFRKETPVGSPDIRPNLQSVLICNYVYA